MSVCIRLCFVILTLFTNFSNRFEDDGQASTPFVATNVPLQPLELLKAQPYMTVGKSGCITMLSPGIALRAVITMNTGVNFFNPRPIL